MPCCKRPAADSAARRRGPLLLLPLRGHVAGRRCAAAALRCARLRPAAETGWMGGRAHAATRHLLLMGLRPLLVRLLPLLHLRWPSRPLIPLPRRLLRCHVLPPELRVWLVLLRWRLLLQRPRLRLRPLPLLLQRGLRRRLVLPCRVLRRRLVLPCLVLRRLLVGRGRPARARSGGS